ncbi:MotA/TolQ/ExbB proton channel family protein [Halomonas sp. HP20-15]|uniref:MotA/TolQ/ExbB proton channel family protein n=1 Tax=Halomonas sp. HP20-15 TaxID=3085901 RepID=UPI0029819B14|nr:MotA/TolQ/ExbB proton channel family protein [Halomonas sp. HP20-15]MDW5375755.1 MotA/TolQ/ExbB proton channel family protein [Halomonas sp. HP20-15]
MRRLLAMSALLATVLSPVALAQQTSEQAGGEATPSLSRVLEDFRADSQAATGRDRQRLAALLDDREALEAALGEARARLTAAQGRREALESQRNEQRRRLNQLREQAGNQTGDLGGVQDVISQRIGALRDEIGDSWLTVGSALSLPERPADDALLNLEDLATLGDSLAQLTAESGRVVRFEAPVAGRSGEVTRREVMRPGAFAAFSEGQLLRQPGDGDALAVIERTPDEVSEALRAYQQGQREALPLDPSQGQVLKALSQRPDVWQRFQHGGYVGYVIVALGVLGLLVAVFQYAYLLRVSQRLRRQLRDTTTLHDDNPLGRILKRFKALGEGHAPEALEARLDEALLAEQPRLERGQPLVKLLAAVAPLLGLLGTVTGMIVTFQSITVFGTGDPQLMAGGISQALVTTVLGLITAVPLLFAQTALASRSRSLVGQLEGRASAVLADHLEGRQSHPESRHAHPA